MWFRKKPPPADAPYPGVAQHLDGYAALAAVETQASEQVCVRAVPLFAGLVDALRRHADPSTHRIRQAESPGELAALAAGAALTGARSAIITDSLAGMHTALHAMAGGRLSCVIHLTARAYPRQAGALHGGHDAYHAAAGAGCFQFFASSVQEAVDFTLIAHRTAELSLTPGICALDLHRGTHAMESVRLPEPELIRSYLGRSADNIASPTPAQTVLFGDQRRRVPVLLDPDHPAGVGAAQDHESYFRAAAAQRPFFYSHLGQILDAARSEFAALTGRRYAPATGYYTEDADAVVIAQGAVNEDLLAGVQMLRAAGIRAGVIQISQYRPFPGAQLARLLQGKKSVAVLERTDQPLAEDAPLLREVRAALDKALENGRAAGPPPYADYPGYRQISDRPALYSGIYGVGGDLPEIPDLIAVYRHLREGDRARRVFYVGRVFAAADRHYPHLQTLRETLIRDYPALNALSVHGEPDTYATSGGGHSAAIHFLASQHGVYAVNTFAQSLAEALNCQVRTYPQGGLEPNLQPAAVTLVCADSGAALISKPGAHDLALCAAYDLVPHSGLLASMKTGGTLVIASNRRPESLRADLPRRTRLEILERAIQVRVLDARRIAAESASNPALIDHLTVWTLLGAYLALKPGLSAGQVEAVRARLALRFQDIFGARHPRRGEITQCLQRAAGEMIELPGEFWRYGAAPASTEPEPPWTIQHAVPDTRGVFDATRFWHSVGYLYDTGQAEHTLSDPYLATGIVPAATSAFRDVTPYRLRLPQWLPENCTGCGICWAVCPESALPPVALELAVILQTAVSRSEARGGKLIQLQRIREALGKQAYKLLARDERDQYLTLGPLLQDAFTQTTAQLKLDGEKVSLLNDEFQRVRSQLEHFPIARTEPFFSAPHQRVKNTGLALGITLNPACCTGCGVCVTSCPEGAFAWVEQTPERNDILRHNWQFQQALPELTPDQIDALVAADKPDSYVNLLLSRRSYHATLGGDGRGGGNGARTALRLVTAAAEAVMQRRFDRHGAKLQQLIAELEAGIRGDVTRTLSINDFEDFSRRLSRLDGQHLDAERLAGLFGDQTGTARLDTDKLRRWSELILNLKQLHARYRPGDGNRARMLLVMDPDAGPGYTYPYNPHPQPWVSFPSYDAAGLACSLISGIHRILKDDFNLCRIAELELAGIDPRQQRERLIAAGDGGDLTETERGLVLPVFVIRHGIALSRDLHTLAAGVYPIKLVLINQAGLITPADHAVQGELQALAHKGVPVVQCSIGHPGDLIRGVTEILSHSGAAVLHIHAPDPQLSGIAEDRIIEHAALGYQSRSFPLYRLRRQGDAVTVSLDANPEAEADWPARAVTVRAANGTESTLATRLTAADWLIRERRCQEHFTIQPKGALHESMLPLADYLALAPDQRADRQPYIDFIDDKQRHFIAAFAPEITTCCAAAMHNWRSLRQQARGTTAVTAPPAVAAAPPAMAPPAAAASVFEDLTERLLELCGYKQDPAFFKQTLREFMQREQAGTSS